MACLQKTKQKKTPPPSITSWASLRPRLFSYPCMYPLPPAAVNLLLIMLQPTSPPPPPSPLPADIPHQHPADHPSRHGEAADDGDAHQALARDLVVDERPQVARLQVRGLLLEQQVVVPPGLGVVAQLEVAQGQVVEALAAALGRGAEDLGEEDDAEVLVLAAGRFYEALRARVSRERKGAGGGAAAAAPRGGRGGRWRRLRTHA